MRKILLTISTAAVATVMVTGTVALAAAQAHPAPHLVVTHGRTGCTTLIEGAPNSSQTRFHVSPITNTCNDQYRALSWCQPRAGNGVRESGPWVSGYNSSNTTACPPNMTMVEGGTQYPYNGRHTYCLWGCSSQLLAFTSHPVHESSAPWVTSSCSFFFTSDFNDQTGPIWAQSRKTSATTCSGWEQRSILHWCLRGVCTGGWTYGPWRTSTSKESRATAPDSRASFDRSWIQIRAKAGAPAYCWRTGIVFGSGFFHCGNTP